MAACAEHAARLFRLAPHLKGTTRADVIPDCMAGITVAALAIPQAVAYALVAGLPAEMGLAAAALPCALAALFGSSPYLVTGPTNPTALLLGVAVVAPAVAVGGGVPLESVVATGVLVGAMLIGLGLLGIGRASRFLSDSVIAGFTTGAGLLIALRLIPELGPATGEPVAAVSGVAPRSWPVLLQAGRAIADADARTLALAIGTPIAVKLLRRLDPRWPAALIVLAAASVLAHGLGWYTGPDPLRTIGPVEWQWNAPRLPGDADWIGLMGPAFAIALLVTLQSIAAARSVRPPPGVRLDPDRELVAQGVANASAGLLGAMVTSGSLTRSALARSAGARSRLSATVAGGVVALSLYWLAPLVALVPMAALVGLVVISGLDLVDPRALRRAAGTRGDAAVLVVTLGATLWIDLVQALYVGVFLSLALLVRRSGDLQIAEIVRAEGGRFREILIDERTGSRPAAMLQLEGDLNFAVAGQLGDCLREILARGPRVLVLRLKRARHLDATVLESLREVVEEAQRGGVQILLCGLTDAQAARLLESDLGRLLGEDGLLVTGELLFEGFERALGRTRELLAPAPDDAIFRSEREAVGSTRSEDDPVELRDPSLRP
ncbi:MAG: SulP family inorganic anion transporter [Deltaproteobacteria bacterium]|nr:SulP family inorganic anion transporter [Deltaproteobacteria bacterium]